MAVISITITRSESEVISGIPETITVETSIPSTIFYTWDNTDPDTDSFIYTGALKTVVNGGTCILKLFATNGSDESVVVTAEYKTNVVGGKRSHSSVSPVNSATAAQINSFPFGSANITVPQARGKSIGITVDAPDKVNVNDGYSGDHSFIGGTDLSPIDYELIYSITNRLGERGRGIGTLPHTVKNRGPAAVPQSSNTVDRLFNPKALVIYQNSNDENAIGLNKNSYSSEDAEKIKSGSLLFATGRELPGLTGSLVRQFYNDKDGFMSYYYFDSQTLKWVISKTPYTPKSTAPNNLGNMPISTRSPGSRYAYSWIPFASRKLT